MINRISTLIFSSILLYSVCAIGSATPLLLQGRGGTGVTAEVLNYALNGNIFSFTIENTSISPGTTGTITNIGFDLPGQITATSLIETSGAGNYSLANSVAANATGLNTILDFAMLTQKPGGLGVSNGFNGGFVASGIGPGSFASFSVTASFNGLSADSIAGSAVARFQNVEPGGSDVATVSHGNNCDVPEPGSLLLLGTGLVIVSLKFRKSRLAPALSRS